MTSYRFHSRTISDYYQKGVSAFEKKNYDYAIEMLLEVIQAEPRCIDARQHLHRAERLRAESHPLSLISIGLVKLSSVIPYILALIYEAKKEYEKAIAFYEDLLKHDLANPFYLRKIHQLAFKNQWIDVAVESYESLFELEPENAAIACTLGELYRDMQDIERASSYFQKSLALDPLNQKVSKSLKDLEALHTIKRGGWDKSDTYRTKMKDVGTAEKLEQESKYTAQEALTEDTLTRLKAAIAKNPSVLQPHLQLIDHYLEHDALAAAEETLAAAEKLFPENGELIHRRAQHLKKTYYKKLTDLDQQCAREPNNTALVRERDTARIAYAQQEIAVLAQRVALYPNDLAAKFDLGEAYALAAQHDKAIAEFQQAVKDPALATRALNKLGRTFHAKGMYDLAVLQFKKALEKVSGMNELSKEILYNLGTTLEAMGKGAEAIDTYKKIYEVDIAYRDIAKKIETFYRTKQ